VSPVHPPSLDIGHDYYLNPEPTHGGDLSENRSTLSAVPPDKADKGHNIVVTGKVSENRSSPDRGSDPVKSELADAQGPPLSGALPTPERRSMLSTRQ